MGFFENVVKLISFPAHLQYGCSSQPLRSRATFTVPKERVCTGLPLQMKAMASRAEKKRKQISSCDQTTQISQIKGALEEVIVNTNLKETGSHEVIEHLNAAHKAMEMACSLLLGDEQIQKTMNTSSRSNHKVSMVGRAALFHQWRSRQSDPLCPTGERRPSSQPPACQY